LLEIARIIIQANIASHLLSLSGDAADSRPYNECVRASRKTKSVARDVLYLKSASTDET